MLTSYVQNKLEARVVQFFSKHPGIRLILVAGSAGKVSTKRAIADVVSQKYRVRMRDGAAYNPQIAMLLGILGIRYPKNPNSLLQWHRVLKAAKLRVEQPADADVIIQELYTEKPGDMARFAKFLSPDIAVVAAVTPEHMDVFGTIEAVAQEELSVTGYTKFTLINHDDIDARHSQYVLSKDFATYGIGGLADYRFEVDDSSIERGYTGRIIGPEFPVPIAANIHVIGEHSIRPVMAAVAVAAKIGMSPEEIRYGVEAIRPAPGRMNLLQGIGGTLVIDDTYNSSPISSLSALQTLYSFEEAPSRIAVMADMTSLGQMSQAEHEKIGKLCNPDMLSWVVLVGPESEKYLAPVARSRGCQVKVCKNAIEAGTFVRSIAEEGAAILVKGPRNGFYMEETVKILCNISEDMALARQSADWLALKSAFFERFK